MADKMLELKGVTKSFTAPGRQGNIVLQNLDMSVNRGEFVVLLGPSGCGKSTLVNIIAGFEDVDEGSVSLEGKPITGPSSERGVVFQNAVLFPWLTVGENLEFGLKRNKVPKPDREELKSQYLKLVQMENYENYYSHQLSGGMQQRASLARTLALHPKILLMDEPFSALDLVLRNEMQKLVLAIKKKLSQTILMVTHDIEEALLLADRIYILGSDAQGIIKEITVDSSKRDQERMMLSPELLMQKNNIMEIFLQKAVSTHTGI